MSQRFTDDELAAEKWHKMYMWRVAEVTRSAFGSSELFEQREHEASTIIRFATLPHAHEPEPRTIYVYDQHGRCVSSFAEPWPESPFRDWPINTGKDD